MNISGIVKSSLIDYPGKISAVVFTQGCNFRCGFCHNPELIGSQLSASDVQQQESEFFKFLKTRRGKLDAVVVTGGEPTLQADLLNFIKKVKNLGFLVKLDTNGSNPVLLTKLISSGLLDYIAMDIKGPLHKYERIAEYSDVSKIKEAIRLIINSGLDYEFRTTVLPAYLEEGDFYEMAELLEGAKKYVLQGFRPEVTLKRELHGALPFKISELETFAEVMKEKIPTVEIRNNF